MISFGELSISCCVFDQMFSSRDLYISLWMISSGDDLRGSLLRSREGSPQVWVRGQAAPTCSGGKEPIMASCGNHA